MNARQQLTAIWLLALIQGVSFAIIKLLILTTPLLVLLFTPNNLTYSALPLSLNMVGTAIAIAPFTYFNQRIGTVKTCIYYADVGVLGLALILIAIYYSSIILLCMGCLLFGLFNGSVQFYRFIAMDVAGNDTKLKNNSASYITFGGLVSTGITPLILALVLDGKTHVVSHYYYIYITACVLTYITVLLWQTKLSAIQTEKLYVKQEKTSVCLESVLSGISYFVMMLLMTPATPYFKLIGLSFFATALIMQLHFLGMFLPSLGVGRLITRFGQMKIAAMGFIAMAIGALILIYAHSTAAFSIGLGLVGVGWNFSFIASTTMLAEHHPKAQMKNTLITFLAAAVGSVMSTSFLSWFGWTFINILAISLSMLCLLFMYLYRNNNREAKT